MFWLCLVIGICCLFGCFRWLCCFTGGFLGCGFVPFFWALFWFVDFGFASVVILFIVIVWF